MSQTATVPAFRQLRFEDNHKLLSLVGSHDENLIQLEEALDVSLIHRGSSIIITGQSGASIETATQILDEYYKNLPISGEPPIHAFQELLNQHLPPAQGNLLIPETSPDTPLLDNSGNGEFSDSPPPSEQSHPHWYSFCTPKLRICARNAHQDAYLRAIREATMVFGLGAAGTGKTFLAVAMATAMLHRGEFERVVLTRPAKEAGEQLGFLPGNILEKLDPYLRPIHDALEDTLPKQTIEHYVQTRQIEIAPLAYMRGRSLKNAVVILDEAQNTTVQQMLMFLTRIGEGSKMIINGDPHQIDLPAHQTSGLVHAAKCLKADRDIRLITFVDSDIVRHPLIARIVSAFSQESV